MDVLSPVFEITTLVVLGVILLLDLLYVCLLYTSDAADE